MVKRTVKVRAILPDGDVRAKWMARALTGTRGVRSRSHDTFYGVHNASLKVRSFQNGRAVLIYDDKLSSRRRGFRIPLVSGHEIRAILARSLHVRAEITKSRRSFSFGDVKINIDSIDGYGKFVEVVVRLLPLESKAEGRHTAIGLIKCLGVADESFLLNRHARIQL